MCKIFIKNTLSADISTDFFIVNALMTDRDIRHIGFIYHYKNPSQMNGRIVYSCKIMLGLKLPCKNRKHCLFVRLHFSDLPKTKKSNKIERCIVRSGDLK